MNENITPYRLLHGFQKRGGKHYYGVKAGADPTALLGRGVFDLLRDAKSEANKYPVHEIWAYDENEKGERTRTVCVRANFPEAEEYALHISLPNVAVTNAAKNPPTT